MLNIDRAFAPVVSAYMMDNRRHRFILGPFGCLSAESQVLTPAGWVRMDAYREGTKIAQWRAETGGIEWVLPDAYTKAPCEELIRFDSGGLVMELSSEHRVPNYDWGGKFNVARADRIEYRPSKRTIPTVFRGPDTAGLPLSDALLRFAVMMHADGHYPPRGQQGIVCVRKERKKARIREILTAIGVEWEEVTYPARPTETHFRFIAPYVGKRFSSEWYQANAHQLQVIVDEYIYWDGGQYAGDNRFFSVFKEDAEFIQYANHACGRRATLGYQEPRPNEQICWTVHGRSVSSPKNVAMIRCDTTRISRVVPSDGMKYCFAVPTSFFVARCEGTIFITGNSGKSVGSQTDIVRRAAMQAPSTIDGLRKTRFAVVRQTRPQLRSTTMKTWFDQFPNGTLGNFHGLTNTYTIKQNDILSEVVFLPLDTEDDVKNLLSYELTGVYLNEFRDIPRAIVEALDGRIGRYPRMEEGGPTWVGIWGDSNMPEIGSYWHSMLTQRNPDEPSEPRANKWGVFIQPPAMLREAGGAYVVNPAAENLAFLPPEYYQNLIENKTTDYIRTYVMCEFGRSRGGKPVHPLFDIGSHVSKAPLVPDKNNLLLIAADFGLTPALCLMQQNAFGQVLVFDSIATFGMGLERAIEEKLLPLLRRKYDGFDIFVTGDPSGSTGSQGDEQSCADVFRRYKNRGLGKVKFAWSNNPIHRQGALDYFLSRNGDFGRRMFQVDPGAEALIAALGGGYMFKLFKDGRPTSEVDKTNEHSHIGESCEYGCMYFERGGRRKAENLDRQFVPLRTETNIYATPR